MKKFKKVLLGALSVLTFGLLFTVGTRVDAATTYSSEHDYMYKGSDFYSTGSSSTQTMTNNGIVSFTGKFYPGTGTETNGSSSSTINYFSENNTGETFDLLLTSGGGSRTITVDNTSNTQKLDVTSFMVWIANQKGITVSNASDIRLINDDQTTSTSLTSGTKYTPNFSSEVAKVQTLKFTIDGGESAVITPESNVGFLGLYADKVGSVVSKEDLAVEAIEAIGTISYTKACSDLIATATQKVNACTNGISDIEAYDTTNSTSYAATYTSALATFNSLKTTAITTFTTSVANIGEVTISSGTAIETAETAYAVLFGDALTNDSVVTSKSTLDTKKSQYSNLVYDSLDKFINANSCALCEDGAVSETQCANSIFSLMPASKVNGCNATYDGTTYTQRIQTAGSIAFTGNEVSSKAIKFKTKSAGVLKILAQSAKSTDATRTLSVYASGSKTAIYTSESGLPLTVDGLQYDYINIPSAGTYYIGSSVNNISIYYASFTPATVSIGTQTGTSTVTDGGKAVRAVAAIVLNDTELTITSINVTITGLSSDNAVLGSQSVEDIKYYTSLTGFGDYEFPVATYYTYYSVYGLDSSYNGKKIKFEFEFVFSDNTSITKEITETISFN